MKNPFINQVSRFSIRKYSVGVASVVIGASFILTNQVFADQTNPSQPSSETLVATTNQVNQTIENLTITSSENTALTYNTQDYQLETIVPESDNIQVSNPTTTENLYVDKTIQVAHATQATNSQTLAADIPAPRPVKIVEPLPSQGTYIYPENMAVRNEAKLSAPIVFYGQKGDKISYQQLLNADNTQWIVYKSFSGTLRYLALLNNNKNSLGDTTKPVDAKENGNLDKTNTLSESGIYRFTKEVAVKNQPKLSEKTEFVFSEGETVSYDKVLVADNTNWISYISFSGKRRYVQLDHIVVIPTTEKQPVPTRPTPEVSKVIFPSSFTYTSSKEVVVKNQPKLSATTEFVFNKGETINYDKVIVSDNTNWLSYLSYSGTRRYVQLDQAVVLPTPDKPTKPSPKPTDTSIYPKGKLEYRIQNNGDFTIKVSDVNKNLAIKEVKIPVWSDLKGQDDLVWYTANKQKNGSYTLTVKLSNHKNVTGIYHVDLYYKTTDGKLLSVLKTNLEVPKKVPVTSTTPTKPSLPV